MTDTTAQTDSKPRTRVGQKNIYLCSRCGHGFVTIDRDAGVTPFATDCQAKGCRGHAVSLFYSCPQRLLETITPAFEWYRPTAIEVEIRNNPNVSAHVRQGGLIKRPFSSAPDDSPAGSRPSGAAEPGGRRAEGVLPGHDAPLPAAGLAEPSRGEPAT